MFVFVLVILMTLPNGQHRMMQIDAPSQGQCERVAFDMRHGSVPVELPRGTVINDAYCIREYET